MGRRVVGLQRRRPHPAREVGASGGAEGRRGRAGRGCGPGDGGGAGVGADGRWPQWHPGIPRCCPRFASEVRFASGSGGGGCPVRAEAAAGARRTGPRLRRAGTARPAAALAARGAGRPLRRRGRLGGVPAGAVGLGRAWERGRRRSVSVIGPRGRGFFLAGRSWPAGGLQGSGRRRRTLAGGWSASCLGLGDRFLGPQRWWLQGLCTDACLGTACRLSYLKTTASAKREKPYLPTEAQEIILELYQRWGCGSPLSSSSFLFS